ncbi:uncharacterized protein TRIADDRAFT_52349 [Trichoplax adhaerens]|uniref:Adenomatous polyposis coli protein n=1 Tax=Trichoplax adhaerens TaxID=10228 RepID=B3RI18_TRIAD|nr:hypothetical protein TRIADDRAFT_52349 [Trichoplax adhaerens]EDV29688.1 hypothetical protein TRIADDRAFT_52349 [Trichoplax adhaerens]|eukprot:XP_002108890.1 hypothetical protein TRIADDRAFT_52349 [Trichoplax adhaerens]
MKIYAEVEGSFNYIDGGNRYKYRNYCPGCHQSNGKDNKNILPLKNTTCLYGNDNYSSNETYNATYSHEIYPPGKARVTSTLSDVALHGSNSSVWQYNITDSNHRHAGSNDPYYGKCMNYELHSKSKELQESSDTNITSQDQDLSGNDHYLRYPSASKPDNYVSDLSSVSVEHKLRAVSGIDTHGDNIAEITTSCFPEDSITHLKTTTNETSTAFVRSRRETRDFSIIPNHETSTSTDEIISKQMRGNDDGKKLVHYMLRMADKSNLSRSEIPMLKTVLSHLIFEALIYFNDPDEREVIRNKVSQALHYIINLQSRSDESCLIDSQILRHLDQIRLYCDALRHFRGEQPYEPRNECRMKAKMALQQLIGFLQQDNEVNRMRQLGASYYILELFEMHPFDEKMASPELNRTIYSYADRIAISLTCKNQWSKEQFCTSKHALNALKAQLNCKYLKLISLAATVCCNLAKGSNDCMRQALNDAGIATSLLQALEYLNNKSLTDSSPHKSLLAALWNFSAHEEGKKTIISYVNGIDLIMSLICSNEVKLIIYVTGLLRNLSTHLTQSSENCEKLLKGNCLKLLVQQLLHSNLDIVVNTAGIIWNLSAHDKKIQDGLIDLGIIKLLDGLMLARKRNFLNRKDLLKAFYAIQNNLMLARADRKKLKDNRSFRCEKRKVVVTSVSLRDYESCNQLVSVSKEGMRQPDGNNQSISVTGTAKTAESYHQLQARSSRLVNSQITAKPNIKNNSDITETSICETPNKLAQIYSASPSVTDRAIDSESCSKISVITNSSHRNGVIIKNSGNSSCKAQKSVKYRESKA